MLMPYCVQILAVKTRVTQVDILDNIDWFSFLKFVRQRRSIDGGIEIIDNLESITIAEHSWNI